MVDLLETSRSREVLKTCGACVTAMWNEDIVPATTIIRDRSRTPLHVMQEMLLGKLDLQSGWEAPDVRFMRQDGSDAYVDGNGIIVWMPKDDTFFARNHLKVCCITFKEYLVHE